MQRVTRFGAGAPLVASLAMVIFACGAKSGLKVDERPTDAGRDVRPDIPLTDVASFDARDAFPDAPPPDFCVPFDSIAGGADLDIFILMDFSASMERTTLSGISKKDAVTNAVEAFVNEESSRGLGVSLTFFPFDESDYPIRCDGDSLCNGYMCIPTGFCGDTTRRCEDSSQCTGGDPCVLTGWCPGPDYRACVEGQICNGGANVCGLTGICANPPLCWVESYQTPAVPVDMLPAASRDIVRALRSRPPVGSTPTLPALTGIIDQARARLRSEPERTVVVLLATDGLPSSCDPNVEPGDPMTAVDNPEAAAASGAAEGISTFVIGVFREAEEEEAQANLTRLAVAGGTEEARIVTTDSEVSEELLEALNALRRSLRTCAYSIPAPGTLPRPEDVNVSLVQTTGDEEILLQRLDAVSDASRCDAAGGFYFRPDGSRRPSVIELCPASCTIGLQEGIDVRIDAVCTGEDG